MADTTKAPTPPAPDPTPPKQAPTAGGDDVASLRAENERLRAQVTALGQTPVGHPGAQHQFVLTEGDRAELEMRGMATINGKLVTVAQVRDMLGPDQQDVKIVESKRLEDVPPVPEPTNIRGFDYVYPSVSRGEIDPAVAGMPGISGPAADSKSKR